MRSPRLSSLIPSLALLVTGASLVLACSSTEESQTPVDDASISDSKDVDGATSDGQSPEGQPPPDGHTSDTDASDGESPDAAGQDAATEATTDATTDATTEATTDAASDVIEGGKEAAADGSFDVLQPDLLTLTFSIDDSVNKTYEAVDGLAWKGAFSYDVANNLLTHDSVWAGPYVPLSDDGPLSSGGHEAEGAVASDHVWTTQVRIARPAATLFLEYGAIRGSTSGSDGQWIWTGTNGMVKLEPTMAPGTIVAAPGLAIPAWGTVNVYVELDTKNVHPDFQIANVPIKVKTNVLGWREIELLDNGLKGDLSAGDGVYLLELAANLGKHDGLLHVDDRVEFVFIINGVEYKDGYGNARMEGVSAGSDSEVPGTFALETVTLADSDNTSFVVGPN